MQVSFIEWRQLLQPFVDVLDQSPLVVIHINPGSDMHGGNQRHAIGHAAGMDDFLHLRRNVNVFAMLFSVESDIFGMKFHSGHPMNLLGSSLYEDRRLWPS